MKRTEQSIKNSIAAIIVNITTMLIGFISQAIFIRILGAEYLGLNGLFSNVLTMLSIAELGIGSTIIFNLYKPIAYGDTEKIKSLMFFYKKAYNIIAIIVLSIGLLIIPFINNIVGVMTITINIYFVYFLNLGSSVSSYILSYKRSILYADQKKYIINYVHIIYLFVLNISQLVMLYITKNYYLYLLIKIICQILENIAITIFVNKNYRYLKDREYKKIDKKTKRIIFIKIKGLIYHKIGNFLVWGTDNILISKFFGVITVGIYSNYNLILNALNNLFYQFISSTSASVGNLLIENNKDKNYNAFENINFLNFCVTTFSAIAFLVIVQPFIIIWVGEQYLFSTIIIIVLTLNYYQKLMRTPYDTFKESAGIWHEDRFIPIIESILNIVFSIIFLKIFGLIGVFWGTIISGLALWCYSYPKFVYKKLFSKDIKKYYIDNIKYLVVFLLIGTFTYLIASFININNIWLKLIINCLIGCSVPIISIIVIYRHTEKFKYFYFLIINRVKKIRGRIYKNAKNEEF